MADYCYILEKYYEDHPDLVKILDPKDESKHNVRTHLCLSVKYNDWYALIPLRKNLGDAKRAFGIIGYSVPSASKPRAGLDYRYIMIIKEEEYLRFDIPRISKVQKNKIDLEVATIEAQAIEYIESFIRVAKKDRVEKTARFRASSLINFIDELKINDK